MSAHDCAGCGEPVEVGDEDSCDGTDAIREIKLLDPDRYWHRKCWSEDQMRRPKIKALSN